MSTDRSEFVKVKGSSFEVSGKPYYFIGANFWYGAYLGSTGEGGNRDRLIKELDLMQKNGIDNLRILIGADGPDSFNIPTLQKSPGVYNQDILNGLDFLLSEMSKRKIYAVLFFTNSWEWSGGYGQYLGWAGKGDFVYTKDGWEQYKAFASKYAECEECNEFLKKHINYIINRENQYTGVLYKNDPTIMSWQIANEPRAFSDEAKPKFEKWVKDIADYIKSLDENHLVSTGSEGEKGSENDIKLYESIHSCSSIDYLTIHLWPKNWGWARGTEVCKSVDKSINNSEEYIKEHMKLAVKYQKPMVIEEFGYPRNHHKFTPDDETSCRDKYYNYIMGEVVKNAKSGGLLGGCNFWAWGGYGRPSSKHVFWERGDDYLGDPFPEEQGLNSVFNTDASTLDVIRSHASQLQSVASENNILSIIKKDNYVDFNLRNGLLRVNPLADNTIRVRFYNNKNVQETESLIFTEKVGKPSFSVVENSDTIYVITEKMRLALDKQTATPCFMDSKGSVLLQGKVNHSYTSDIHGEPTNEVKSVFVSPSDEFIFGTGQFQDGQMNLRGLPRRLTQVNSQISIPFIYSSKGYGLLWHNYGMTNFNPTDKKVNLYPVSISDKSSVVEVTSTQGLIKEERREGIFEATFTINTPGKYGFMVDLGSEMARRYYIEIDGKVISDITNYWLPPTTSWIQEMQPGKHTVLVKGVKVDSPSLSFRKITNETVFHSPVAECIDYTVFTGSADNVIASYRELTGQAPLMPIWALGYIHSRERFSSQEQLLKYANEFRKRKYPIDVIVQDWKYWGKYGWNSMIFDEKDYPNPKLMTEKLHKENLKLMVSVWSKIDTLSVLGTDFKDKSYFIPGTAWVDFFNPKAANYYWNNMSERLLSLGIDSWWQDATEPENDALTGTITHAGKGEKVRLIYPLLVNKTVYEGQRKNLPDNRVFILSRSAYLGQQKYASATWSGDIGNDWETFKRQIPAGLNYSITGLPYWTTDCGGFFRPGEGQYTDKAYHERFLRWLQFSIFCPLLRVHGCATDTEFWNYGPLVEKEAMRYLNIRYKLLPYIYSESANVTFNASTLMRPLVMDFPNDVKALEQSYQYMFGRSLLVAPVVEPNVTKWNVYLPENKSGWYDFWTGKKYNGGKSVMAAAPISIVPVFVKAGSILPMGKEIQYTTQKPMNDIELRIYSGVDGEFLLYEDEGVNNNYEKGMFSKIKISWDEVKQQLKISEREGTYPGMDKNKTFRIMKFDGENNNSRIKKVSYSGSEILVQL
jgi:alpha-D-xyloside xylohydrolase